MPAKGSNPRRKRTRGRAVRAQPDAERTLSLQAHDAPEMPGVEVSPELRAALLEPSGWRKALESYARGVKVAVALADAEGRVGEVINPKPIWKLLRGEQSASTGACPFSVAVAEPCTCVARALAAGGAVVTSDRIGLVHFTVPVVAENVRLGALIAGQIFAQYPNPQALERVARQLGVSATDVWQTARRELPVGQVTLGVYAELLATVGATVATSRYHALVEADRLTEMTRLRDQVEDRGKELVEADHRKDEFLAMLAHELRNPLAPLVSAIDVVRQRGAERRPAVQEALNVMERQVRQLVRLVDDLLDVGRITTGSIRLQQAPADLGTVVADAVEVIRPAVEKAQQMLEVALPPEPIWVAADRVRLIQILTNLLTNAVKFTPRGGRIRIALEAEGPTPGAIQGRAHVTVSDTGVGITAAVLPHVFDLFVQGEQTLGRSMGGLGVGLTVVRRLVELHGGSVEARSAGPRKGSDFVVRLPRIAVPTPSRRVGKDLPALPARRRVLVVDDNRDAAAMLGALLTVWGQEVQVTHDGAAAVDLARVFRPEVVLLDIGLPHMDGYEVARRLRADAAGRSFLLVAVTGYGREADHVLSKAAGFDHHFVKPIGIETLQSMFR